MRQRICNCVVLATLLVLAARTGAVVGPQLLLNAGFQTGTNTLPSGYGGGAITGSYPDSWWDNSDWASPVPNLVYSLVTTNPRTTTGARNWCVKVNKGFAQVGSDLSLKNGTGYTLSAWFRVSAATLSTAKVTVGVGLQAGYNPWNQWDSKYVQLTTSQGWQQVTVASVKAVAQAGSSSGSAVPALFLLYINNENTTVCVDDALAAEAVMCSGNPPTPTNGNAFACPVTSVDSKCFATCKTGFTGLPYSVCSSTGSGTWGTVQGICTATAPVTCSGNPPKPPNGTFACNATTPAGGRCNATCSTGFTGAPSAVCSTNGTWGAVTGTCSAVSCTGNPLNPGNGTFACGTTAVGGRCNATCNTGYSGSPYAVCSSSGWGTVSGGCTAVKCNGNPPNPGNGSFACTTTAVGGQCNATCNTGFSGSPFAVCSSSGSWSTVSGTCTAVKCSGNPPNPPNGAFACSSTAVGGRCTATCNTGFSGLPFALCLATGAWGALNGTCTAVSCTGNPPNPGNGTFVCGTTAVGGRCNATCNTGYSGSPYAVCSSSGWGTVSGGCTAVVCSGNPTPQPGNGTFSCPATTAVGQQCAATCNSGFQGNPTPTATCQTGGIWGTVAGKCTAAPALSNVLKNADLEDESGPYSANAGAISGIMPYWWYDNSEWASPSPVLIYSVPTDFSRTGKKSLCVKITSGFAQFGQSTAVHAPFNYTASAWFKVRSASAPVTVTIILQQAFSPYTWYGSASATLTTASPWTQVTMAGLSQRTQADPSNPSAGAPVALLVYIDTPNTEVCVDDARVWEIAGVTCSGNPPQPTSGTFACPSPSYVGDTCTATCALGFTGTPAATCTSAGKWSAVTGSCAAVVCSGNPPQPSYGTFSCPATTAVGGKCTASCLAGYQGSPTPTATCSPSGQWSILGQCVRPNVLVNGGMDAGSSVVNNGGGSITGVAPDNWFDNSDWATPVPVLRYSLPTDLPRTPTSSRSWCVQVDSGFAQFGQPVLLNTSADYALSTWLMVRSAAASTTAVTVRLVLQANFPDYQWWGEASTQLTMLSGWTQLTVSNLTQRTQADPTNPTGGAPAFFVVRIETPGATVCVDDAQLSYTYAFPKELLSNANFDGPTYTSTSASGLISGTWPNGWGDNTDWVTPPVTIQGSVVTGAEARSGQALKLNIVSGVVQFAQFLTIDSGTAYRMSIWVRAVPPTPPAGQVPQPGVSVTLYLKLGGEPMTSFGSTTAVITNTWTQLVVTAVVPPAKAPLSVAFFINTGGSGTIWLDDASLTPLPGNQPLPNQVLNPLSSPIDMNYFCMNINGMFGQWLNHIYYYGYTWPVVDFGVWRTWDSGCVWATMQPINSTYFYWDQMDTAVAQATSRNQKVLFTLGQSPGWASSNPTLQSVLGTGWGSPPSNVSHWKAFVRAVERRYKGIIVAYEVWNEPNLQGNTGFYNGSPEQLSALALATQQVLQQEGSTALLLNPPMAGVAADGVTFLNRYFTEAARLNVVTQGIAWHSYNMPAELDIDSVTTLKNIMAAQQLPANLPIYNTEAGILDNIFASMGNNHTLGAAYLAKVYVMSYAIGVSRVCWYAYDAATMEGLDMTSPTGGQLPFQLNVAGQAYQRIIGWLLNASMTSMSRSQGVWVASLSRVVSGSSSTSWVVWNGDSRVSATQMSVPATWNVRYVEDLITGARTTLAVGTSQFITVGEIPMLLRQV